MHDDCAIVAQTLLYQTCLGAFLLREQTFQRVPDKMNDKVNTFKYLTSILQNAWNKLLRNDS